MNSRSDAGAPRPAGLAWLPRPLAESEFAAAPVLASADDLIIDDLTQAEDLAFSAALAAQPRSQGFDGRGEMTRRVR